MQLDSRNTIQSSDIRIGWWYTTCCSLDAEQILTDEDLDYAIKYSVDNGYVFFPSLEELTMVMGGDE
jgi:hypothetical protein